MSVKIKDNTVYIKGDNKQNTSLFIRLMLQAISREADPATPRRQGELRRNKMIAVNGLRGTIEWRSRYAKLQEENPGGRFKKYTTGGTGAHFAENAVKKASDNSEKYYRMAQR